jgi:hypothetical protein
MSALAEIKLRSADLLYSGKAVEEVVAECAPEIINPLSLCNQDMDALLVYLRVVTYGDKLSMDITHDCRDAKQHTYGFNLGEMVQGGLKSMLTNEHYQLAYTVTLENGQVVKLRPQPFRDVIAFIHETQLASAAEDGFTAELAQKLYKMNLLATVASVDGISDREMIEEWVKEITPSMRNAIINQAKQANNWGFDLKPNVKCRDCGAEYKYELPLNPVTFFSE